MKKLISTILMVCLLFSSISALAAPQNQDGIFSLLAELNIMKGDPDGNLRLDDTVSRAEFTKVAVAASAYRNSVATNLTISPFKDVLYTHWAAPYIKLAVSNNICKGYPDASFNPDGTVLYEEAVTMLLKVLGYNDNDFGISWPYGQIGLADNLEITKNVSSGIGRTLTRRDVAVLVYNTLDTKMKNSNQKLITIFDCQTLENVTIIATTKEDSSIGSDKVLTSSGIFTYNNNFDSSYVGKRGDLVVKNGDDFISFAPNEQTVKTYNVTSVIGSDLVLNDVVLNINENLTTYYKSQTTTYKNAVLLAESGDTFVTFSNQNGVVDYAMLLNTHAQNIDINVNNLEKYVVYSKLENAIVGYKNGAFTQIDIKDSTACYKDKVKLTYGAVKAELAMGDIIYVKKDEANLIDYVSYEKGNIIGPITVTAQNWQSSLNADAGVAVMRDGNKVNMNDLQINDIAYYSKDLNMILGYSNKITGIYEKAMPNKDMPTSVVVSGKTYQIEGVSAFEKLSSRGSFNYGDTVTLLLGKTNQIADVMLPDTANGDVYGYLFDTGTKEFIKSDSTRYTDSFIKIALPDGGVYEYICDKDYKNSKNSVVRLTFSNGIAKVTTISGQSAVAGDFKWQFKKLGNFDLSPDVNVLDVTTLDSNRTGKYTVVFPQRIDGVSLNSSNILYTASNEKGQIISIILNNVTGDAYDYGIVKEAKNNSTQYMMSGSYTYDIGGALKSFVSTGTIYGVQSGQPAKFIFTSIGTVDTMQPIEKIDGVVSSVTTDSLVVDSKKYIISDKVCVYKKTHDYNYMIIPLSDIINNDIYNLTPYFDKPASNGGRIRVIIASEK